jgi:hypothetical protein
MTIIDPTEVGPLDVCLRCFAPHNDRLNYCEGCGKVGSAGLFHDSDHTYYCVNHPKVVTTEFCGLCADPLCKACQAHHIDPFSSPVPVPYCAKCMATSVAVKRSYFERLKLSGACGKHGDQPAQFHCKTCTLALCRSCAYFHARGIFGRRAGEGPFCLTCFRRSLFVTSSNRWISGTRVASRAR